ncbi:hypothetical protein ACR8AL_03510 [Clavibacter sepedonicus]|uniref:Membrane anchored protein n=1 Tax=Clavibacter sepedonicus TaxID=31964 RepID=B0RDF8_CLASE|nr:MULTISPECIES: hypothetical protein [Clavibacter]MBD5381834.1 hypothetical protein [Clavibacter sp.]OQJ47563.1 hypothetical protein B5P19_04200 [Clavibacter sepedonicus]OQJ53119.1 hypothetical protein B5P20_02460 [Clavibacter sepedonicus]UUK64275.1 hypothetical protein LRE50_08130 [Clavibacter sepedonicus]CAQ01914.1 putative membrane anchored protein [Clavibacter sepedonicus]
MTPSHDAPDTGPTSFDDGPAPATLGLSRREMRAAERARARELGIDEAGDAPADESTPVDGGSTTGSPDEPVATSTPSSDGPDDLASTAQDASAPRPDEATTPPAAPGIGPDTSAILLSGGVLTRRQLRAIREAEEAAREQHGSDHEEPQPQPQPTASESDAEQSGGEPSAAVDDAPPTSSDSSVPPFARYGRGSRATPRPRAPYGSAYRRASAADTTEAPAPAPTADDDAQVVTSDVSSDEAAASERQATPAETPSAWPFAPIVPSGDAADRDVDASGEQPTVPPLAAHTPSTDEDPRPAPSLEPTPWVTGSAEPSLEPAFGTRASAAAEDLEGARVEAPEAGAPSAVPSPADATAPGVPDARTPFTPPAGHWSVQDQVDEDQPHTGNHFILPTVPHVNDMQQALNSTGEIIITGSIDLPRSLGSMGTHPDRFDTADMDRILEQGDDHDHAPGGTDSEPVRASRAVSTHTSTRAVVQPPPRKRFTAPVVAAVAAGGVAVIGAGLVIVAFMTNVF